MTVYGEVTEAGKARPLPTAQNPLFYIAQAGGYKADEYAVWGEKIPSSEAVTRQVTKALKSAGYLEAPEGTAPNLVIVFNWGSRYERREDEFLVVDRLAGYRLIGGSAFANEIDEVFIMDRERRDDMRYAPPEMRQAMRSMMPLELYKQADDNNAQLVDQAQGDFYYILVSAYDYPDMLQRKRTLLWRTHLTVDAGGVSMHDTLDVMMANGARYLGKDTGRPGSLSTTVIRRGRVEIGAPQKVEMIDEPAPEKSGK